MNEVEWEENISTIENISNQLNHSVSKNGLSITSQQNVRTKRGDFVSEYKFENLDSDKEKTIKVLSKVMIDSVNHFVRYSRTLTNKELGISFSGGIDSTLIAFIAKKKLNCDFTCYTVGLENSQDIIFAKKIAENLSLRIRYKILSLDELEVIIKKVAGILKEPDVTKVSVGSVLYGILEMAKKDNIKLIFTGLGSEEVFAGYNRHLMALDKNNWDAVHKECWKGLKNMWQRDLSRDFAIADKFDIKLATPFLEKDLIVTAMNIHPRYKIDKNNKKIILREVAEKIGLPREFAWRQKKAAQYGTRFINGMNKIAKKKGFRYKRDYLEWLLTTYFRQRNI